MTEIYQDDGYTGTNFDRPAFRRMEEDVHKKKINCILVKDLSRFGRDYIEMGRYLEREFPAWGVRFIAINDHIDSRKGQYDMLLPMKNIFNTQYARDISGKVRSSIQAKQRRGEFVGAFASYGYQKDEQNHNQLLIDPPAAQVVQRIFDLFEQGMGQLGIAKLLNREGVPSPSEYKRAMGERYHNGRRLQQTSYWTYATVHRMLKNRMYAGDMEQGRTFRATLHGRAQKKRQEDWVVVPDTHQAIISKEQWERVQRRLDLRGKEPNFQQNISPFAGFLRCGDCGRAMVKGRQGDTIYYCCGSYKRYGPTVCSRHGISHAELEAIILQDINQIIARVQDQKKWIQRWSVLPKRKNGCEKERIQSGLERLYRLKKSLYEDYREGLLRRDDYLRYKEDYDHQEQELENQQKLLGEPEEKELSAQTWTESLLQHGELLQLDSITVAETIEKILVFEDGHIEIIYACANEPGLVEM